MSSINSTYPQVDDLATTAQSPAEALVRQARFAFTMAETALRENRSISNVRDWTAIAKAYWTSGVTLQMLCAMFPSAWSTVYGERPFGGRTLEALLYDRLDREINGRREQGYDIGGYKDGTYISETCCDADGDYLAVMAVFEAGRTRRAQLNATVEAMAASFDMGFS